LLLWSNESNHHRHRGAFHLPSVLIWKTKWTNTKNDMLRVLVGCVAFTSSCSMLQRVAACCSVLQCVAVCCSMNEMEICWECSWICSARRISICQKQKSIFTEKWAKKVKMKTNPVRVRVDVLCDYARSVSRAVSSSQKKKMNCRWTHVEKLMKGKKTSARWVWIYSEFLREVCRPPSIETWKKNGHRRQKKYFDSAWRFVLQRKFQSCHCKNDTKKGNCDWTNQQKSKTKTTTFGECVWICSEILQGVCQLRAVRVQCLFLTLSPLPVVAECCSVLHDVIGCCSELQCGGCVSFARCPLIVGVGMCCLYL